MTGGVDRTVTRIARLGVVVGLASVFANAAVAQTSVQTGAQAGNAANAADVRHTPAPAAFNRAQWRIGPFVGRARQSPTRETLGLTPGRDHVFVGVQAMTPILHLGQVEISYSAQLLPIVRLQGRTPPLGYGGLRSGDVLRRSPAVAYAVGFSPFGVELATPRAKRVSVFAATSAGGLVFGRPYPIPESGRFNFTLEYGGGVLVRAGAARWIRAGYKYHHLSNAYTAQENPGVDGNVFYAGFEWGLSLPR